MSGRTTWWAKDAAWHRRELQVELGEEFGAAGPFVLDVLSCWSQEQRQSTAVKGGFRGLARESFVDVDVAKRIVERAALIGALDELVIDEDGRRFTCRVSGFAADQERGRAAWRMAHKRDRDAANSTEHAVTDRDTSRPVTEKPPPDQTKPMGEGNARTGASAPVLHPQLTEVVSILSAIRPLNIGEDAAIDSALRSRPVGDAVQAAHTVASWCHGGMEMRLPGNLLMRALDKQAAGDASPQARGQAAPVGVSTQNRKYDEAAGL